ncbi:MAG: hypothetical protein ACYTKD_18680 [Planctomycetota bacterium]|jgi:hypothetical protein
MRTSAGPEARTPARGANGTVEGRLRFLASFAAGIAAVVLFAWASQARQDARIAANEKSVAVIETRLGAICEKLDDIRELLADRRTP